MTFNELSQILLLVTVEIHLINFFALRLIYFDLQLEKSESTWPIWSLHRDWSCTSIVRPNVVIRLKFLVYWWPSDRVPQVRPLSNCMIMYVHSWFGLGNTFLLCNQLKCEEIKNINVFRSYFLSFETLIYLNTTCVCLSHLAIFKNYI